MDLLKRARRKRNVVVGSGILLIIFILSVAAPLITNYPPLEVRPRRRLLPPSAEHYLGTDDYGRDLYSRIIWAGRLSLFIGAAVAGLTTVFGGIIGLVSGYFSRVDMILMRVMDGLMAFPAMLLAIALMATFGPSLANVIIALTIVDIPRMARIVRSGVLSFREQTFVEAARAAGASDIRIMFSHILRNCVGPITVQCSFVFARAMVIEASLSFLGVGVPPYQPTWGNILSGGRVLLHTAPWVVWFPGIMVIFAVMGANLLGDGLRDILDPRLARN